MIKYCCCCARQFVQRDESTGYCITSQRAVRMGPDKWCCNECAQELDEDGLFPEERMGLEG